MLRCLFLIGKNIKEWREKGVSCSIAWELAYDSMERRVDQTKFFLKCGDHLTFGSGSGGI